MPRFPQDFYCLIKYLRISYFKQRRQPPKNKWIIIFLFSLLVIINTASSGFCISCNQIYKSTEGARQVLLIVNSAIYEPLKDPVNQYISDLEAEDYQVILAIFSEGTTEELKDYIKFYPFREGVVLIGDLPVAEFEFENDFGHAADNIDPILPDDDLQEMVIPAGGYARFPIDLFYMDLDGFWLDEDENRVYDIHEAGWGDLGPEIWVSRMTASPIRYSDMDEVAILQNYFRKNHAYRTGQLSLPQRALSYPDDDWALRNGLPNDNELDLAYPDNTLTLSDKEKTNASDYKMRLKENYEWIHVCVHSNPWRHSFLINHKWTGGSVNNTDIRDIDPNALFYNLFACSNAKYDCADYMAGHYIFARTYGLGALGCTKAGSMLVENDFYPLLGRAERKSIGEAYLGWFQKRGLEHIQSKSWFYGMTLLGDGTLTLDPPVASIISIRQDQDRFFFEGAGRIMDKDAAITEYCWRSNIDGFLSDEPSFSVDRLSAGEQSIYFKVRDNLGRWSAEAESSFAWNLYVLYIDCPVGSLTINPDKGTYRTDERVRLKAVAPQGYRFIKFNGDIERTNNPIDVIMDSDKDIEVVFAQDDQEPCYQIFIPSQDQEGKGGDIIKDPDKEYYSYGEKVILSVQPRSGYSFASWTGNIWDAQKASKSHSITITMDGNKLVDARFERTSGGLQNCIYENSLNIEQTPGGTIIKGHHKDRYDCHERVRLHALADEGYRFVSFAGDIGRKTNNPLEIIMDHSKTVKAVFINDDERDHYKITLVQPENGRIIIKDNYKPVYARGEKITLSAVPEEGYLFDFWTRNVWDVDAQNPTVKVTMSGNRVIGARFKKNDGQLRYALTIPPQDNGQVKRRLPKADFEPGERVKLFAKASPGYRFVKFSGDVNNTNNPIEVTMDKDKTITPVFIKDDGQPAYVIALSEIGDGRIRIEAQSNNFHPLTKKQLFAYGEKVTLIAEPAKPSRFCNWAGNLWDLDWNLFRGSKTIEVIMEGNRCIRAGFRDNR